MSTCQQVWRGKRNETPPKNVYQLDIKTTPHPLRRFDCLALTTLSEEDHFQGTWGDL